MLVATYDRCQDAVVIDFGDIMGRRDSSRSSTWYASSSQEEEAQIHGVDNEALTPHYVDDVKDVTGTMARRILMKTSKTTWYTTDEHDEQDGHANEILLDEAESSLDQSSDFEQVFRHFILFLFDIMHSPEGIQKRIHSISSVCDWTII